MNAAGVVSASEGYAAAYGGPFIVAPPFAMGPPDPGKRTFDLRIGGGVAYVSRCWYMRGPVFVRRPEEPSLNLANKGVETVLSAAIDTVSGAVTLVTGYDEKPPASGDSVRMPLYVLKRRYGGAWRVDCDLRPGLIVLYI